MSPPDDFIPGLRISQDEAFVGRAHERGDALGAQVVVARIVREIMGLAFLLERRYAPYAKWLGIAFARLSAGARLAPHLERALAARDPVERADALAAACSLAAVLHNELEITEPLDVALRPFHSRPYLVIAAHRFASALREQIDDSRIRRLDTRLGAIDQLCSDASGVLSSAALTNFLRRLYGERAADAVSR